MSQTKRPIKASIRKDVLRQFAGKLRKRAAFYDVENWITKKRMKIPVGLDSAPNTLDSIDTLFHSLENKIKGKDMYSYSSEQLLEIKKTADALVYWSNRLAEDLTPTEEGQRPEEFTADEYQEWSNKEEDKEKNQ